MPVTATRFPSSDKATEVQWKVSNGEMDSTGSRMVQVVPELAER